MIQIIGPQFNQWDVGRSVSISNSDATHIHFANQGDSKAVIINIENGVATIPDYLFQTGKTLLAYAVKDGVTLESKSFAVRKRERPENYVYEDDQRNYIYELIKDAEEAVEAANQAAVEAGQAANNAAVVAAQAAQNATTVAAQAVQNADAATTRANAAATEAEKASANANEAANRAKSFMVIGQAEGTDITLDDAIDQFLVGCRVFGKTTQDGTPTPDAPVELVSACDGSITMEVTGDSETQSITIATPNGLPGIPVSKDGNYTDANGQQWICDEIDFARGVYVQRVKAKVLDGSEPGWYYTGYGYSYERAELSLPDSEPSCIPMCNMFPGAGDSAGWYGTDTVITVDSAQKLRVYRPSLAIQTVTEGDSWREFLSDRYATGTPLTVLYALATPIETSLDEVDLANYAELHTYRDYTRIHNHSYAHMEVEYVMDAKKYIDSMIGSSGAAPTKLTNITLLASAWKGSDSLYSQVVSIDGITEYSKVDLLPSVEQLAIFHNKDVAFITENEDGVVTVYAIGDKPTQNYTMQVSITEVAV